MMTFKQYLHEHLLVARKKSGGKLQVGKQRWIHADLLSQKEIDNYHEDREGYGNFSGEMGFVHHENPKKFLTRDQARKYMEKKDPKNLKVTKNLKKWGLHTDNIRSNKDR